MTLSTGQVLDNRYRVVKLLGEGGFGAVYRVWDIRLDYPRALKENLDTSPEAQRQFKREARILTALSHPNLPKVFDHFVIPGQGQYLVMDYVDGEDLLEMLDKTGGRLPETRIIEWIGQVCDALEYLHKQNPPVIHRDIKPANIKITPQGNAMLVDFGIAKVYDPKLSTTMGARAFSPGYSPQEQYGMGTTDARTDIYALGATLYHLLTGVLPQESIQRNIQDKLEAPSSINPRISAEVEFAILKAIEPHPDQRYKSAQDFKKALSTKDIYATPGRFAPQTTPTSIAQPVPQVVKPPAKPAVWKWVGIIAGIIGAVCILSVLAGIVYMAISGTEGDTTAQSGTETALAFAALPAVSETKRLQILPSATMTEKSPPTDTQIPPTNTQIPPSATWTPTKSIMEGHLLNPEWPMYAHDPARTSWNQSATKLYPPLSVDWTTTVEGDHVNDGLSMADGMLYLAGMNEWDSSQNQVVSLTADGRMVWRYILSDGGGAMDIAPAYANQRLFFGGQGDDLLYALNNRTGELDWTADGYQSMYASDPAVFGDILFAFGRAKIAAIDSNSGVELWRQPADTRGGSMAIWGDTIVTQGLTQAPTAYDIDTGDILWQRDDIDPHFCDIIAYEDIVYVSYETKTVALDIKTGQTVWSRSLMFVDEDTSVHDYQMAIADGVLYVTGGVRDVKYTFSALDAANGEILWQVEERYRNPIVANGVVYISSTEREVIAYEAKSGAIIWRYSLNDGYPNFVIANDVLYIAYHIGSETTVVALSNQ